MSPFVAAFFHSVLTVLCGVVCNCSLFSLLCDVPLCDYTIIIHLTSDGCLGCSQHLAIMNCAAMNKLVLVFWLPYICISVGFLPRSRIAGS